MSLTMQCTASTQKFATALTDCDCFTTQSPGTACTKASAAEYFMIDVSALRVKPYFVLQHANWQLSSHATAIRRHAPDTVLIS